MPFRVVFPLAPMHVPAARDLARGFTIVPSYLSNNALSVHLSLQRSAACPRAPARSFQVSGVSPSDTPSK